MTPHGGGTARGEEARVNAMDLRRLWSPLPSPY